MERQVYDIIDQLAENGVHLRPFTFNRFEDEVDAGLVKDPKEALRSAIRSTIQELRGVLKSVKHVKHPFEGDNNDEEVERRVASYYMGLKMIEDQYQELVSSLTDAIWQSGEQISDDELVRIGVKLVDQYLEDDEESAEN